MLERWHGARSGHDKGHGRATLRRGIDRKLPLHFLYCSLDYGQAEPRALVRTVSGHPRNNLPKRETRSARTEEPVDAGYQYDDTSG